MHGPYRAEVRLNGEGTLHLTAEDAKPYVRTAERYYSSGNGVGLALGFTRAAVFAVADLLAPGEHAEVLILGQRGSRRDKEEVGYRREYVSRDASGTLHLSLGCRFNTRRWPGL